MSTKSSENYYIQKKPEIMKRLKKNIQFFKRVLRRYEDENSVNNIEQKMSLEYESLLPLIPYIGGDAMKVTTDIIDSTMGLAFYKVMKQKGYSTIKIASLISEVVKERFNSISKIRRLLMRFIVKIVFGSPLSLIYKNRIKKIATKSQTGEFSNLVLRYVEGDGKDFDFGFDYISCPLCKFWREQDAAEILPYICLFDFVSSEFMGTGLVRTMTLAEGHDKCDFRYKIGRRTHNKQKTQFPNTPI